MAAAPVTLDQIVAAHSTEDELLAALRLALQARRQGFRTVQITTGDFSSQVRLEKPVEEVIFECQSGLHALNPDVYGAPDRSAYPDRTRVTFSNGNTGGTCA